MIYKKLLVAVCSTLIMIWWMFSSTQAQCDACGQTPNELQKYIDTMNQLLEFTVPSEPVNVWASPAERAQRRNTIADINLKDFLIELPIDDEDGWNAILEWAKGRVRDYEKLQDIDEKISIKLLEVYWLWFNWVIPLVWEDQANQFNSILSQLDFIEFQRVDGKIAIADQTYKVYLWMLRRLNAMMKHMHRDLHRYHGLLGDIGKWAIKASTNSPNDVFDAGEREQLKLAYVAIRYKLGQPYIQSTSVWSVKLFNFKREYQDILIRVRWLQRSYECSVWVRSLCETRSKTAESSRRMVSKRWQNDGKSSAKTFNDARGRLKWALWHADKDSEAAAQQRQEQLMSQYRWDDFPKDRKRREVARVNYEEEEVAYSPTSLQGLLKRIFKKKAKWDNSVNGSKPDKGTKKVWTPPPKEPQKSTWDNPRGADTKEKKEALLEKHFYGYFDREEREKRRNGQLDMRDYFTASTVDQEKRAIYTSAMNVLDAQESFDIKTLVYDVTDVTKQFPSLSFALYANANNRWDKSDEGVTDPPIYIAAQSICTNQCSNIQDKQCGALGE